MSRTKANGQPWDADDNGWNSRPDIGVCIAFGNQRTCYPGGKTDLSEAVCRDALTCNTKISVPVNGKFDVEVWDVDAAEDDLIAKGQCSYGETCALPSCTIAVADKVKMLALPAASGGTTCSREALDPAAIAKLGAAPESGNPRNRKPAEHGQTYEYEAPACEGAIVNTRDANSWSYTCHRTCAETAPLGTLQFLAKDEVALGMTTTWYLVASGPLAGTILAQTPLGDDGNELVVQTAASIQDEQSYFIASWLCKNRRDLIGTAKCDRGL